jgi:hypothetical protein
MRACRRLEWKRVRGQISQPHNVIVQTIFTPGIGRTARIVLDLQLAMSGRCKISEKDGGMPFPAKRCSVGFQPYSQRLQIILLFNNYYVVQAVPHPSLAFSQSMSDWVRQI